MIDLRQYFPDNAKNTYNKSTGSQSSRYTFQRSLPGAPTGVDSLYTGYMSLGKPGVPYMWRKEYYRSGAWCTDTYAVLFMGDDKSVTETGDWLSGTPCNPDRVLTYRNQGTTVNTGLAWSGADGLSETAVIVENDVWGQMTPGAAITNSGVKSYSKTGLIERFDTFTPKFGRDADGVWREGGSKTYEDVIHIVMYHGTKDPNVPAIRCVGPISASGAYYQSYKDYNSYAIELWLAKGIGSVQEDCPFIEKGWNTIPNCSGGIFANPIGSWITYIDQQ